MALAKEYSGLCTVCGEWHDLYPLLCADCTKEQVAFQESLNQHEEEIEG